MAEAAAKLPPLRHPVRYRAEALAVWLVLAVLGALPLDLASGLGGSLGRLAGWLLPGPRRRAAANLAHHMPELGGAERARILARMWENFGRNVGEFRHLDELDFAAVSEATPNPRIEVVGQHHLDEALASGEAVMIATAHLGNWEIIPRSVPWFGGEVGVMHRSANNPFVEAMLARVRVGPGIEMIAKGRAGARRIFALIKARRCVGMMVDQKLNDGIAVPFFGREAMTAPALAVFALRYRLTVLPFRSERLKGARFRLTMLPPLALPQSGDRAADVLTLMTEVNRLLESWIRERPEQWLWLHRRWPTE